MDDDFVSSVIAQDKDGFELAQTPTHSTDRIATSFVLPQGNSASIPSTLPYRDTRTNEPAAESRADASGPIEPDRNVKLIEEELQRILRSKIFSKSSRLKHLLEHIITCWLAGDTNQLDGYNLAIAVFDRSESFEPGLDPIVRVQVSRLRNQLAHYYAAEGASDLLRIDIPKGAYIPTINDQLRADGATEMPTNSPHASVMVLPFIQIGSAEHANRCHAIAISDHLIYLLTRSSSLRVTSRFSSTRLDPALDARQLGDHYGAQFIIEGTAAITGDECQVMVHLAETTHGYNVWSGLYVDQANSTKDFVLRIYHDLLQEILNNSTLP